MSDEARRAELTVPNCCGLLTDCEVVTTCDRDPFGGIGDDVGKMRVSAVIEVLDGANVVKTDPKVSKNATNGNGVIVVLQVKPLIMLECRT